MTSLDECLRNCQEPTIWEVGNQTLYDLCAKYPTHTEPSQIVAKTWLIGRTYSVALERRRGARESNEVYYREKIPQVFMSSLLDEWLLQLSVDEDLTSELIRLDDVLQVHTYLVAYLKDNLGIIRGNDGLNRTSFCSKYLHFHRPRLFPIYDVRAVQGLSILLKGHPQLKNLRITTPYRAKYARFCETILAVIKVLNLQLNKPLTLRQVDNLLLQLAQDSKSNNKSSMK
ncbi:hypothetical protein [Spirosoma koreense]